jgi:HSP90 family molecular chaperone
MPCAFGSFLTFLFAVFLMLFVFFSNRYVWESKADGSFAISEDTWNEPLGRGTEIKLHLRDEAKEYLEEGKLKVLPYYHVCLLLRFNIYVCIMSQHQV